MKNELKILRTTRRERRREIVNNRVELTEGGDHGKGFSEEVKNEQESEEWKARVAAAQAFRKTDRQTEKREHVWEAPGPGP